MSGRLDNKVALVTGGGSGIGRASVLAFVREGAKVAVADVDVEGGEATVRKVSEAGGEAIFVKTNVAEAAEAEALVNKIVETYGRLDCAYNNAGIDGAPGKTADCTTENWDRVMNINLRGLWLCMKYEIQQMLKQGKGAIVNTASVSGLRGSPSGLPAYVASKFGVIGVTKIAAVEYAKANIRVNAVCPGAIRTRLLERVPGAEARFISAYPIGRIGLPEEIGEAALWLCSDAASFVTGHTLVVDGGRTAW